MSNPSQDHTTARRLHTDNYECELPDDVRSELIAPKRARKSPSIAPATKVRLVLTAFVALSVIAGLIASWINYKSPAQLAEVKAAIARS